MRGVAGRRGPRFALAWSSLVFVLAWGAGSVASAGGNVTVRVDHSGNLIVEGDGADNEISIRPYDVGAGDVVGLGTTLVNGRASAPFRGADHDFRIRMKGGDDDVSIDDGDGNRIRNDLEIDMGSGNDHVLIRGFFVLGDLTIRTRRGDDTVELADTVFVSGRTTIRTGSGDDRVLFLPADVPDLLLVFEHEFALSAGPGTDFVSIAGARFTDDVDVDLGSGDDVGEPGGTPGGLCVCGALFEAADVLANVRFRGGRGVDGAVLESVCGLAPPGLVQDFLPEFESFPDDCSFLGGEACARGCQ